MAFNIDNVYFKWDDSLKDKNVLVADSLYHLKKRVEGEWHAYYTHVKWSEESLRFVDEDGIPWNYVYSFNTVYVVLNDKGDEFVRTRDPDGCHVFATFNDEAEALEWCYAHDKFAEVAQAWLEGKEIQFKSKHGPEWLPVVVPNWALEYEYRVKPGSVSDFKIGKVYKNEETGLIAMCTAIDTADSMPVCFGTHWVREDNLNDWHEVEE